VDGNKAWSLADTAAEPNVIKGEPMALPLVRRGNNPYLAAMRSFYVLLLVAAAASVLFPATQVSAQTVSHAHTKTAAKSKSHKAASSAPQSIGKFGDWQAATHTEAGQTICYAFARPDASDPALPGRGDVVFTVTERAKLRDTVALSAGFVYPANAQVSVTVGSPSFPFYTAGRSAFARDGAALIAAFDKGSDAVVSSPAPKGKTVTDHFSLTGFSAAMTAVLAACPDRA